MQHIAKGCSIFSTTSLTEEKKAAVSRMLYPGGAAAPSSQITELLNEQAS
jgi:hypothetical protein